MLAFVLALTLSPPIAQAEPLPNPPAEQVLTTAAAEVRRIQALLEKMRLELEPPATVDDDDSTSAPKRVDQYAHPF